MLLDKGELQKAQSYYDAAKLIAEKYATFGGDALPKVVYGQSHITNADEVIRLWWQAAKAGGEGAINLGQFAAMLAGIIGNTPIESYSMKGKQLSEARATGHGMGLGIWGPIAGAVAAMGLSVGSVATLGLAPLLLGVPMLAALGSKVGEKKHGGANKPAHELAHAIQYLVLGLALRRGILKDPSDIVGIQNTVVSKVGLKYLWGGETETSTIASERRAGNLLPVFERLDGNARLHLLKKYGPTDGKERADRFTSLVREITADVGAKFPELVSFKD